MILLIHPPSGSASWLTPSRRGRRHRTNPPRAVVPPGCGVHNGRATFESTTSADARVSAAVKETSRFSWATNVEAEQLEEHRADIARTARDNAKAAAEDIAKDVTPKIANALGVTAATASAVLHPLVPLAGAAAAAVIGIVVDKIIGVMKGKNLTTWSIGHTVITDSKLVPLSIFTLSKEKETKLCELVTGKSGKQKLRCSKSLDPAICAKRCWLRAQFGH